MRHIANKAVAAVVLVSFFLSSCVTTQGSGTGNGPSVGPLFSSNFFRQKVQEEGVQKPKLNLVVPVFDPGIPGTSAEIENKGIWPELRRAEATRFAYKLKQALDDTGAFGAVRVTPDRTATGDLYVLGKIDESDGEDVEIDIEVVDISGKRWMSESFDHEVQESFYQDYRNKGRDPYDPLFEEAAKEIVEELDYYAAVDLEKLQTLTTLRFGANFSEEAFSHHMKKEEGRFLLASMPSDDDPMLRRINAIRVRDQLFVDGLQSEYQAFSSKMETSYLIWQEQAGLEKRAKRKAQMEAAGKILLGVLAIAAGAASAYYGGKSDNYGGQSAGAAGAVAGGAAGVALLQSGFQSHAEAQTHKDSLNELGKSIDMDLAPQVVEFEKQTAELTGDAKQQFAQWRIFLKEIYEHEATPLVKL